MRPNEPRDEQRTAPDRPQSSPYGPQPGHVDEAAGGADSSPFETLSSDEREQRREAEQQKNKYNGNEEPPRH